MAKKLHLLYGLILLCFFLAACATPGDQDEFEVPWFVGCFNNSEADLNSSVDSFQEDQVTPFSCVHLCVINSKFRFAAVKNGNHCFCLSQIQENSRVNQSLCNLGCHGDGDGDGDDDGDDDDDDDGITCGGTNLSSVYSLAVPLVVSLNVSLPEQVKVNTTITAIAGLSIKRPMHEISGLDKIRKLNQTADIIIVKWYSGSQLYNTSQHALEGNLTTTFSTVQLSLIIPGNHNICVEASNLFSYQKTCSLVFAGIPITGLKLVAVEQGRKASYISPLFPTLVVHLKYRILSGTRPKFRFDFGDGGPSFNVSNSTSGSDSLESSCVTVAHGFTQCGNVTVNVTASNALSQLSLSHQVNIKHYLDSVEIVTDGRSCINVEANVSTTLTARVKFLNIREGCLVSYQWQFNSSANVTTQVPTVSHVFSGSQQIYYVTVRASSETNSKEARQKVCIQQELKGVFIKPNKSYSLLSTARTERIQLSAELREESDMHKPVSYMLYRSDERSPVKGRTGKFSLSFRHPGWVVVYVQAYNKVSRVNSTEIVFDVRRPVSGLRIHHERGVGLRGTETHLRADLESGTNVTFYWNFGDGSPTSIFNTTSRDVYYNYTKNGRYLISVTADNVIDREEASIYIAIIDDPKWSAPEVTIYGPHKTSVSRSQEIHLEAYATLPRNATHELVYKWKVSYNDGSRKGDVVHLDEDSLSEPVLLIPERTLDYGEYVIQVEVYPKEMTELKAVNKQWIKVVQTPLVAIIEGATMMVVGGENEQVVLDASSSFDPDYSDDTNISFEWLFDEASCFKQGRKRTDCLSGVDRNKSKFSLPLDCLKSRRTCEFSVKVKKDSRQALAFKYLYLDKKDPHVLSTNCPQCVKGPINPRSPLIITGLCLSCQHSNISYEWKLFHVGKSKLQKDEECKANLLVSTGRTSTQSPISTLAFSTTQIPPTTRPQAGHKPKSFQLTYAKFSSGDICEDPDEMMRPNLVPPPPPDKLGSSGGGGISGNKKTNKGPVSTKANTTDGAASNDDDDPEYEDIYDPSTVPRSAKKYAIFNAGSPSFIELPSSQTSTGTKHPNLVLLGNYLPAEREFMVAFVVTDQNNGRKGIARIYINTNTIYDCGICQVTPDLGTALHTPFKITCTGWSFMKMPPSYDVRYSVDNGATKEIIYSGYRSVVQFYLPAGKKVNLYVTVEGEVGTRRSVEAVNVTVEPPVLSEGVSMEEYLLNKTVGVNMVGLLETKDEQGTQQLITALAKTLNGLGSVKTTSSKFDLRVRIRERLLHILRNYSVYDKTLASHTGSALQALTKKPEELSAVSVENASEKLQNLGKFMRSRLKMMDPKDAEARTLVSQELVQRVVSVTSSLIEASSRRLNSNTMIRKEDESDVLLKVTEAAEELIKARLSTQVWGEKELRVESRNIRVIAIQESSVSNAFFHLGDVSFHMPTDLEEQLQITSSDRERKCFGAVVTVYDENPFFSEMHHTKVASLSIDRCNGEEIEVKNLSSFIDISIPYEKQKLEQSAEIYTLRWEHQNTHIINQTERMTNQSLQIHLKPITVLPVGFVIKLTASTAESDSGSLNQYTVTSSGEPVELYLSGQQLQNVSGSIFARVVLKDTAYYRIKSVNGVPKVLYSLRMHWVGCFYWNKQYKDWSSDGCELTDQNSDTIVSCRCNHLTAFSGAFLRPPNSLREEHLADISRLKESPITLAVVVCITFLYMVLLVFCVRAEKNNKENHETVYIDDNTVPAATSQRFQITVQTGHWFGAGTTAGVYVVLHGEGQVSNPIELKYEGRHLFQRSSCDVFVVSVPISFKNNISKIHVWHDNVGEHPGWFLERITIKDVSDGMKWIFDCNRWLAVDEGNGKVECELLPNASTCNSSLKKCFSQHITKSFVDYHLWISLLGRPSYSRFTRPQRLTCCWSLLLSFLCVNIAWYRPKSEVPEVLGILDLNVESILVGIMCSVLVLPINLLWIFLFRYSRRSFKRRVKVYPISEHQTETSELPSSSVLDQSLETVLFLKNIGERRWLQTSRGIDAELSTKDSLVCHPGDSLRRRSTTALESSSDGISLGYNTGNDSLSSDPHLQITSAGLTETVDFLAALAPPRKKLSVDLEKQSVVSVCVSTTASEGRGPYYSRFNLPHVCNYVAWFGCLMTGGIAGWLTIWFGLSFGPDMSIQWLQSLCFSLLESILISQPIMVLLFILLMARRSQVRKEEESDEGFEDLSTSALHEIHYGHVNEGFKDESSRSENDLDPALAIRKRLRYLKFLKPPSKSKLSEARETCIRKKALWNYTVELLVFISFLVVTSLLVASVTSADMYHLNQSIKNVFLRSENPWTGPASVKDAWKEISDVFNENKAASTHTPFSILLPGSQSLLFGPTKITQYKFASVKVCENRAISANQSANVKSNTTVKENNTTLCHNKCHADEGTWMNLELNQTRNESVQQLEEIVNSQWINECTREFTVEFTVYTPFLRAISAATLSVKASNAKKPGCHLKLNTFPAFFKSPDYGYFVRILKLVFVLILLYLLQHEFFLALKMSTKYFTDVWRLFQLLTVVLGSVCVVMFIHWSVCLYALLREVETTSQTKVFHYATLVFFSQAALQTLYSLILFFLVVRGVYMLRPFRFLWRVGRIMSSAACSLLACMVLILIFVMAFSHLGHLLFGPVHSAFKSFGETFLLVSNFFRMNGVSRYQDPALEGDSVLMSFYFALFLVGFCVVMRGTTAAVFVSGLPHLKKRRKNLLSDVLEDFIRTKFKWLEDSIRQKVRRDSTADDHSNDDGSDEDDDEFELEGLEEDSATFPTEHVLDVVDDQIHEMIERVEGLFGSDLFMDCYTECDDDDDDDDVEYLYQADHSSLFCGSGYESDHSAMSAAKWQLSSSSSHDVSDEVSRSEQQNRSRSVRYPFRGSEMYGFSSNPYLLGVNRGERSNLGFSSLSLDTFEQSDDYWDLRHPEQQFSYDQTNILRDIALRDSDSRDGVLRDYNSCGDELLERKTSLYSTASSSSGCVEDLRREMPIKPKSMYSLRHGPSLKGSEAFPSVSELVARPNTSVEGERTRSATNSSSGQEPGKRARRTHARKGFFRSSAVHPSQEGASIGHSPPMSQRAAHRVNVSDSGAQAAWGPAPSVSSPAREGPEQPVKGLLGDISMNRRLGTEIKNDDERSLEV